MEIINDKLDELLNDGLSKYVELNQSIINYLNYYLGDNHRDFAVLIEGHWGCGKTSFIKKYLTDRYGTQRSAFAYVTLNGVSDIREIWQQIYFSGNSKYCWGSRLAGMALQYYHIENIVKYEDFKKIIKNKIVVVDDLERCQIPMENLLGFLASMIEQEDFQIIIIGNPSEFPDENVFNKIREKIIGKTFSLNSNDGSIIPTIIESLQFPNKKLNLKKYGNHIVKTIRAINNSLDPKRTTNYRAVKNSLREFHHIFSNLSDKYIHVKGDFILKNLIAVFIPVSYAIQLREISETDIPSLITYHYFMPEDRKQKLTSLANAIAKNCNNPIFPGKEWESIFLRKSSDTTSMEQYLDEHFFSEPPKWLALLEYYDQDDETIDEAISYLDSSLEKGEIRNPQLLLDIFRVLFQLRKFGYIKQDYAEIRDRGIAYINRHKAIIDFKNSTPYLCFKSLQKSPLDNLKEYDDLLHFLDKTQDAYTQNWKEQNYKNLVTQVRRHGKERFLPWFHSFQLVDYDLTREDPEKLFDAIASHPAKEFREILLSIADRMQTLVMESDFWKNFAAAARNYRKRMQHENKEHSKQLCITAVFEQQA